MNRKDEEDDRKQFGTPCFYARTNLFRCDFNRFSYQQNIYKVVLETQLLSCEGSLQSNMFIGVLNGDSKNYAPTSCFKYFKWHSAPSGELQYCSASPQTSFLYLNKQRANSANLTQKFWNHTEINLFNVIGLKCFWWSAPISYYIFWTFELKDGDFSLVAWLFTSGGHLSHIWTTSTPKWSKALQGKHFSLFGFQITICFPTDPSDVGPSPSHRPSNGGQDCPGVNYEYQLCNTNECPKHFEDFRAQQCQNRNSNFEFQNAKHHWLPYEHPDGKPGKRAGVGWKSTGL